MYIYVQNEVVEYENNSEIVGKILDNIDSYLYRNELNFSHLVIDDVPVYGDFYNYIIENIKSIKEIRVVIQTVSQLVNETLLLAHNYIDNSISLINKVSEEFYQQPNNKTWQNLIDLFEGIQWIIQTLTQIDSIRNLNHIISNYEIWNEYVQAVSKLKDIIPEIESAMISKDNILVGDILLYEIVPTFEEMLIKLQSLNLKVVSEGVN